MRAKYFIVSFLLLFSANILSMQEIDLGNRITITSLDELRSHKDTQLILGELESMESKYSTKLFFDLMPEVFCEYVEEKYPRITENQRKNIPKVLKNISKNDPNEYLRLTRLMTEDVLRPSYPMTRNVATALDENKSVIASVVLDIIELVNDKLEGDGKKKNGAILASAILTVVSVGLNIYFKTSCSS